MAKVYRFNFKNLDVYQAAVDHLSWVIEVLGAHPRTPFPVRNQVLGAAVSIAANVAEANGRDSRPGETEQHYRYAQGSAYESAAYLDVLAALSIIDDDTYSLREERLARTAAMLHRLAEKHSRRRHQ